jgi:hypothetical protein
MATATEIRRRMRELAQELLRLEQETAESRPEVARFTVLEDAAVAVGDAITAEIMERELSLEAECRGDCPGCGQRGLKKGERQRVLQTRRGEVKFAEPEFYCPRCRRAFFPSFVSDGFGC